MTYFCLLMLIVLSILIININNINYLECNKEVGGTAELKSEIIDQTANTHKLLTLEALHIWRERPRINTLEEFKSQELTLKIKSMYNMA